eukprot:1872430-Amphidinium_carterae.1
METSPTGQRGWALRHWRCLKHWHWFGWFYVPAQVLIIGGDVHEGGWTDMKYTGKESKDNPDAYRIRQLTTSAIAQKMTQAHEVPCM